MALREKLGMGKYAFRAAEERAKALNLRPLLELPKERAPDTPSWPPEPPPEPEKSPPEPEKSTTDESHHPAEAKLEPAGSLDSFNSLDLFDPEALDEEQRVQAEAEVREEYWQDLYHALVEQETETPLVPLQQGVQFLVHTISEAGFIGHVDALIERFLKATLDLKKKIRKYEHLLGQEDPKERGRHVLPVGELRNQLDACFTLAVLIFIDRTGDEREWAVYRDFYIKGIEPQDEREGSKISKIALAANAVLKAHRFDTLPDDTKQAILKGLIDDSGEA